MAPVRQRNPRRTVANVPSSLQNLIKSIERSDEKELLDLLSNTKDWKWPKGDIYSFINILNKFDKIFEVLINERNLNKTSSSKEFQLIELDEFNRELLNVILKFLKLLFENCSNRKLFNSIDRLDNLLLVNDLDLLLNNLKLLFTIQGHTRSNISVNQKVLLTLSWNWVNTLSSLSDCLKYDKVNFVDQVQFKYFDGVSKSITVDNVSTNELSGLDLFNRILNEHKIPLNNSNNFDLFHLIRLNKSFDDVHSRQKLVQCKLLSHSIYLQLVKENQAQHSLLIFEPTLIQQLSQVLQLPLTNNFILEAQATSIICLESLAHYKSKISEVLSCLNAGVNQGLLLTFIRNITNNINNFKNSKPFSELIESLFSMLSYISTSHSSGGQMLVGAGLISLLIDLFKVDNSIIIIKCLQLLDSLLFTYRNALPIFVNAQGLTSFVEKIHQRVNDSVSSFNDNMQISDDLIPIYGTLPITESQALKSSLRSIYRLLTSSGTEDGMRNLIDTSLLQDIHTIIDHRQQFGASILSYALNIMATFVHNEPTSLSIIQEAKLPSKFYDAIEENIEPSFDVINVVFYVISACCLNENGLKEFVERSDKIIPKIFEIFTSEPHVRILSEKENAMNIGSSVDELIRHQPSLKPKVLTAINNQIDNIVNIGQDFKTEDVAMNGISEISRFRLLLNDEGKNKDVDQAEKKQDPFPLVCIDVAAKFLESVFSNGSHAREFLDGGGLEKIGQFFSLPCLPYDFSTTKASESIAHLGRVLIETKPESSLSWSLDQVKISLENTKDIWSQFRKSSLFKELKEINNDNYISANKVFRSLVELYARIQLLADMFSSLGFLNIRVANGFFLSKLNESKYMETMFMIGSLERNITWEHLLFSAEENQETEFDWKYLDPKSENKPSGETYERNLNIMMTNLDPTVNLDNSKSKSDDEKKEDESNPTKLNHKSLTHISSSIPQTITPFFQSIIKMFLFRRSTDPNHKKNSITTSKAVAEILVKHLSLNGNGDPRLKCAYICTILKSINLLFFDERTSHHHLQTPLVFAFAQKDGVQLLVQLLEEISAELTKQDITTEQIPKTPSQMQQFRLYRVLENILPILHTFAATNPLLQSSQTGPLQLRETDKKSPDYFNANDFLVRLRAIMMPVVISICQSEWLSKAPLPRPTRLIVQTLLNIVKGEGEIAEPSSSTPSILPFGSRERFGSELQDLENALTSMRPASSFARFLSENQRDSNNNESQQQSQASTDNNNNDNNNNNQTESNIRADPALVEELVAMDFPSLAAERALEATSNDPSSAAEYMISRPDLIDWARDEEGRRNGKDEEMKDLQEYQQDKGKQKAGDENKIMELNIDIVRKNLSSARKELQSTLPSILLKLADSHNEIIFDVKDVFKSDEKDNKQPQLGFKALIDELENIINTDITNESKLYVRWHLVSVMLSDHQFLQKDNVTSQRDRLLEMTNSLYKLIIESSTSPAKWFAPYLLASGTMLSTAESIKGAPDAHKATTDHQVKIDDSVDYYKAYDDYRKALFDITITAIQRMNDSTWKLKKGDLMTVLQVLVLLTRDHDKSYKLFSSGGLQMINHIFKGPLENASGSTLFINLLLRHMIEDESTLKSTMNNEILSYFASPTTRGVDSGSKVVDVTAFSKATAPLVLRDPKMFLNIVKDNCMLVTDSPAAGVYHIRLKKSVIPESREKQYNDENNNRKKDDNTEMQLDDQPSPSLSMPSETLESILQFLVSELMTVGKIARTFASKPSDQLKTDEEKSKDQQSNENKNQSESSDKKDSENKEEGLHDKEMPEGALEFLYTCFLLQLLTEICSSYPASKINLVMTNKKRQNVNAGTPFKPKITFLNFLISELISMPTLALPNNDGIGSKQRALAEWAIAVLVSVCSDNSPWTDMKEIPNEIVLTRKFVLDVISKLIKDNSSGVIDEDLNVRYARLTALSETISRLIDSKPLNQTTGKKSTESSVHMAKVMLEKNYVTTLTHALGDIDISFPNAKIVIGALLIPLERLTKISIKMAKNSDKGKDDEGIRNEREIDDEGESFSENESHSSDDDENIEDNHDDRAGTPDLYRNSALGMYSGENYEEEGDSEEEMEDDEAMEDMEVDFGDDNSGESSESSSDDNEFDEDDEADQMDAEDDEDPDEWIDEEDNNGGEVDFDDEFGEDDEALDPVEETGSLYDEPVAEIAPSPEEDEPDSAGEQDFDEGLLDDGFSETDDEGEDDGITFRDDLNLERPGRFAGIIDGRPGMNGEANAILGGPLLGGGASRRRMFGGHSHTFFGGGRSRGDHDTDLPQHPLLVDQAPPTVIPQANESTGRRQGNQRQTQNNTLIQTIESMLGRDGVQFLEQLIQREAGIGGGVPSGARVHLEVHSPNGPSGSIPIEQFSRLGSQRDQTPQTQSANIMSAVEQLTAQPTFNRYHDECKLLYNGTINDRVSNINNQIVWMLMPDARELSTKAREEEEQRKKEEEEKAKKEAEEKEKKEAEEKAKKEAEEKETKEREEEMREVERTQNENNNDNEDVNMNEDDNNDTNNNNNEPEASTNEPRERVFIKINGSDVDITDTGIDPSFMEALPDDMREEVLTQHLRETNRARSSAEAARRRNEGQESPQQISSEFLDALPPDLRAEILQQEAFEQIQRERRQSRGGNNNNNTNSNSESTTSMVIPDVNAQSLLGSIDPTMRQIVMLDEGDDMLSNDIPVFGRGGPPIGRAIDLTSMLGGRRHQAVRHQTKKSHEKHRRDALQLLDKNGLAILVKLLFYPNLIKKSILFRILSNLIENSRSRVDLLLLLINILQEGTLDIPIVDRSFSQLTLKGKATASNTPVGTPTGKGTTKRKYNQESLASPILMQIPPETIPNLLAQRCFETLTTLVSSNANASNFFLTEHDLSSSIKSKPSKKSKGKEKQSTPVKFPIVLLMGLLDREAIFKTQMMMDTYTTLLATVTKPLSTLKKTKEIEEKKRKEESQKQGTISADKESDEKEQKDQKDQKDKENKIDDNEDGLKVAPQIPSHVLKYVVNILTIGECSSKTFQQTLSLIQNLSYIPDAKDVIASELRQKAQEFGQQLNGELEELGNSLTYAKKSDDVKSETMEKFLPASSLQARLLRVLKTVDYMFGQSNENLNENEHNADERPTSLGQVLGSIIREDNDRNEIENERRIEDENKESETSKEEAKTNELKVNAIYDSFNFGSVWKKLSDNLSKIEENDSLIHIATVLLPLIESLMVVCKYVNPQTAALRQKRMTGSPISPSPQNESIEDEFIEFTEKHRKIINTMVRNNPALMSGSFSLLVQNPRILEFDNKRSFFMQRLKYRRKGESYPTLHVNVRRQHVFADSFHHLQRKSGDEIKYGKLAVKFYGEEGVDAGGVAREWFQVLAQQMFNPNYALFQPCDADKLTYQPNRASYVNEHHLSFFKFVGRIIGKAIYDGRLLDAYFTRSFYKHMLGRQVDFKDLESVDLEYYNSLVWMLENSIEGVLELTFSVESEEFGVTNVIDLKPNGRNIPVTDHNKKEYVKLVTEHRLTKSIEKQIQSFLEGFHEIIPKDLIKIFSENELELLISGLPDIDVDAWKNQTDYHGFTPSDPIVLWFWRVLRSFDSTQKASFLQFVTGSSRVPLEGFGSLQGSQGTQRFNIHKAYGDEDRLPAAHTCFNQLDLGPYSSYEALRRQILTAIHEGNTGFGFA